MSADLIKGLEPGGIWAGTHIKRHNEATALDVEWRHLAGEIVEAVCAHKHLQRVLHSFQEVLRHSILTAGGTRQSAK